jgi:hypothetical protein
VVVVGLFAAIPASANAADPNWDCRSSVLRVSLLPDVLPIPAIEPLVGNSNERPCADADQAVPNITLPPEPADPAVSVDAAFAKTDVLCADDDPDPLVTPENNDECDAGRPSYDQQVVSRAGVADLKVTLPGLPLIAVDGVDSSARAFCDEDNQPSFTTTSTVAKITIGDQVIEIPPNGDEIIVPGQPLIRIALNEKIAGPEGQQPDDSVEGSIMRAALHITVGPNDAIIADVAVGEAKVGYLGDVCPEGTVVVNEETIPIENPATTVFSFEGSAGLVPSPFSLKHGETQTFTDVFAGSHTVTQAAPAAPYSLQNLGCSENKTQDTSFALADRRASIELQPGETVTCTFFDSKEIQLPPPPGVCPPGSSPNTNGECIIDTQSCPAGSAEDPVTHQCVTTCPPGSVKNAAGQCVITNVTCPEGTVFNPGSGSCLDLPTGGRLVPLGQVGGFQTSPCRSGGGKFGLAIAVVGTNGPDRITGTNRSDRMFGYGGSDRISGGRGNDCVEGGTGRDIIDGSNGDDRLRGGSGRDRLQGGFGTDRLEGGSGNDGIHTGNGRGDRAYGGSGNDIINAATVGPPAFVDCGSGKKDRVRVNTNELRRTRNCEFRYILRRTKIKR